MFSRVKNCMGLPGYETPHAIGQMKLSVQCARAFLAEVLRGGGTRSVLSFSEKIYHFCHDDIHGIRVTARFGVDPFDAVSSADERLPEKFRRLRYPQMKQRLDAKRQRSERLHQTRAPG